MQLPKASGYNKYLMHVFSLASHVNARTQSWATVPPHMRSGRLQSLDFFPMKLQSTYEDHIQPYWSAETWLLRQLKRKLMWQAVRWRKYDASAWIGGVRLCFCICPGMLAEPAAAYAPAFRNITYTYFIIIYIEYFTMIIL